MQDIGAAPSGGVDVWLCNRSCDKPIDEFDVVSGWLVQSDVCGGLESYAIGISPPSITLAGVKSVLIRSLA